MEITSGTGITLNIDVATLLQSIGYASDDPEEYRGTTLREEVVATLAREIRKDIGKVVAEELRDSIREHVAGIVMDTMAEGVQQTTDYGEPRGPKKSLRELIGEEVRAALVKPVGDSYSSRNGKTLVAKLIQDEVGAQFKADLKAAADLAKQELTEAMRTQAAAVITETVQRMAAGR